MDPYVFVREATNNGESLISLCAGIGLELYGINSKDVTAVDIAPQYTEELIRKYPTMKVVCSDALDFIKSQPRKSVDVISIIDGIEHMSKEQGKELISHMKRVAREKILLFTPEGYLKNEPHDAWGISGADHHQTHKSGWTREELNRLGFKLVKEASGISQHDEPYVALMTIWTKDN